MIVEPRILKHGGNVVLQSGDTRNRNAAVPSKKIEQTVFRHAQTPSTLWSSNTSKLEQGSFQKENNKCSDFLNKLRKLENGHEYRLQYQ